MPKTPSSLYAAKVRAGDLSVDPGQKQVLTRLDELAGQLDGYGLPSGGGGGLAWLFKRKQTGPRPKPVYVWGDVGRGKTLIMDLFHEAIAPQSKRRVHFHAFMQDVHADIHTFRQGQKKGLIDVDKDPIKAVAGSIAKAANVLCLDEFQVKDITDAMILGRLFEALMAAGCIIVVTSNIPPDELYRNGLNRNLFEPFIELIKAKFEVVNLNGPVDYRLDRLAGEDVYFCPLGPGTSNRMKVLWHKVTGTDGGGEAWLDVGRRKLHVPRHARGAAWFSFSALCDEPLGNADFLKIAETYRAVFIDGVRELRQEEGNAARRFINLVDNLYDKKVRLVVAAETTPENIYRFADTPVEFARTVSRLNEMQSASWWEQASNA
ncbi:MAG: cell division protein ZapE [Anderseniella sp.]|nr:cell division protein ZapE [Anderseniella sp.]